ncbi:hypothetical protein LX70_04005 [Defluviimonas denitrificans]|jgi:hypothetical protein|uniref:Uncharacterized protein n=1 Tax=Albidovulum denitrificans TaxID=404881 RepID=A0A2S8RWH5_9RHOB|nr:hypothetical protein [Defluviimonas denitrificans]PQV52899.1 hypothetical protein LX70_04005 [Defluviimonas denitrificans]
MATYTTVTDIETGHKKPVTTSLLRRLRDNPIAMFEGASGAPRLDVDALENPTLGDVVRYSDASTYSSGTGFTYTAAWKYLFVQTGEVRLTFTQAPASGSNSETQVVLNGSVLTTYSTSTTAARSIDLTIAKGDVLELRHRANNASNAASLTLIRLKTAGENLWPFSPYAAKDGQGGHNSTWVFG